MDGGDSRGEFRSAVYLEFHGRNDTGRTGVQHTDNRLQIPGNGAGINRRRKRTAKHPRQGKLGFSRVGCIGAAGQHNLAVGLDRQGKSPVVQRGEVDRHDAAVTERGVQAAIDFVAGRGEVDTRGLGIIEAVMRKTRHDDLAIGLDAHVRRTRGGAFEGNRNRSTLGAKAGIQQAILV